MALAGEHDHTESPYARASAALIELGYHAIPIMPPSADYAGAGKAPGNYKGGRWLGAHDWQRFRDRAPTEFELSLWTRNFPDANIGIVCGSPAGADHVVIAVDLDTGDYDELEFLRGQLPASPMIKKGAKGLTLFYRAPIAAAVKSKNYDKPTGATDPKSGKPRLRRVADLLTGCDTRQTVAPPSVHPDGPIYSWLAGPVAAVDLPVFDDGALAKFEEACWLIGCIEKRAAVERGERKSAPPIGDGDDYWSETKAAAMARLGDWLPALDLYGLRPARRGYEAVATWRSSSTGRPLEERKRNLSIQPDGIKDFGSGDTYSPIDLVMAARGVDKAAATAWLRDQLGLDGPAVVLGSMETPQNSQTLPAAAPVTKVTSLEPSPRLVVDAIGDTWDAETGEVIETRPARVPARRAIADRYDPGAELPARATRLTGLLGALTDWIADTARRPQRGLALGAALTVLGTAAGRRYGGPTRTGTQLYVLGVARTGAGKDHPLQQIGRLLRAADMAGRVGPSQFMSMSAVINRMARSPITVSAIDEFGSFLGRVNNKKAMGHEKAISGVLRQFWGASFQTVDPPEWAGRSLDPIHSPCLSIFGVATPEEFYASLAGSDVTNGFLNRFLLLSTRERPSETAPKCDGHAPPIVILAGLADVANAGNGLVAATSNATVADGPQITAVWRDSAAKEAYAAFGREIEQREEEAAFYARTVEMAQRIATIKAIGDNHELPQISVADVEWACALALWSAERMRLETRDYMAETQSEAEAQLVLRLVRETGRISRRDLLRKLRNRIKGRDLGDTLKALEESGELVAERTVPASGGPATIWYGAGE